jgi:hypothetical protein
MDVSNGTGEGTDYRTGSGTTKARISQVIWKPLPDQQVCRCANPKTPWTIWFRLQNGEIVSATFDRPVVSVTLVKTGNYYQIDAVEKPVKKRAKKRAKKPVPPAKAVKAAKNAA